MDMTKKEYLDSLQKKSDKILDIRLSKGIIQILLHASALVLVTVLVVAAGTFGTNIEKDKAYKSFLEGGEISYEHLNYKDTFVQWNQNTIGNDVNVLLSGGKILIKDGLLISGAPLGKINEGFLFLGNSSYLNKVQDEIVYRDDKDRCIYGYNIKTKMKRVIHEGNSGEVYCTGNKIYFIDYDQGSEISCIDLSQGTESNIVVSHAVTSFAVCADNILYLNTKQELYRKVMGQKNDRKLASHIERFFLNGNIIVESKNNIIEFTPTGDHSHVIYQSDVDNMRLVGASSKNTYIQEDSHLICLSETSKLTLAGATFSLFSSIAENQNGAIYGTAYMDKDGKVSDTLFKAMKKVD
jgi:hypothetical protein